MRETRKSIKAENTELRAKLAVHDHATRKSLNEYVSGIVERNKHLVVEIGNLQTKLAEAERKLAEQSQPVAA